MFASEDGEAHTRESLRRACQKMAAKPEANNTHVPGSGMVPVDPLPQGPTFFFFSPTSPTSLPVAPFFFTGPQTPTGNGGGEMGIQFPPPKGLFEFSGGTGSRPGGGPLSSADWKGTGGACIAVPWPVVTG